MKKLIFAFMISILMLTSIKAEIDSEIKSRIKIAIKESKPDIVEEILKQVKLTEKEKINFIVISEAVLKIRNEKRLLNLVKPELGPQPGALRILALGQGSFGALIALVSIAHFITSKEKLEALGCTAIGSILIATARKFWIWADEEANMPYRTPNHKWLDALEVNQLLKSIA